MKEKERQFLQKGTERKVNGVLLGLIIFLLAVIVTGSIVYMNATRPMRQAEEEATKIAKKYAKMDEVDEFYWFNRDKTYFSLVGKNTSDQDVAVIIPKSGEKVKILDPNDGLTEEEAMATVAKSSPDLDLKKANLGMYKDKPVWEVVGVTDDGTLTYTIINFEDGKEVKVVEDI